MGPEPDTVALVNRRQPCASGSLHRLDEEGIAHSIAIPSSPGDQGNLLELGGWPAGGVRENFS